MTTETTDKAASVAVQGAYAAPELDAIVVNSNVEIVL